ncbi:MAG: molybdenum cofactor guanylyltransferase MobA [Pseudomonadota bacterium]
MTELGGVILAGGPGRRMGNQDKASLTLAGERLLDHVLRRLSPQVGALAINANGDPERFGALDVPVVPDGEFQGSGPLSGVLAGLDWAGENGLTEIVTVPVDTPFFPENMTERLAATARQAGAKIAIAETSDGRHPTCAFWSVALRDDLRRALADGIRKMTDWADRHGAVAARFDDPDAFFNVNTPEDLARAKAHRP